MIYVKDNYTLENEQTVILLEAYPETLFTNSSDEEAVLEYSHDGTKWNTLLTLAPKQKQTTAVTSRYIRQTTQTTVEAKAVGNHITPLVLAGNPLHSGADFSNYITKPQLDSVIAKVNDKTALLATQEQLQTATQTQTRALTAETQQRHSQIDTINQTITRNKQAQDELINQKANQTALAALEAKVTANTAKNQSQDTEIAKKANQASLTAETTARNQAIEAVKGTIANNKQTQDGIINQLRADMATKANQSALDTETANRTSDIAGLTQTVNTHKQQLDGQIRALEQNKVDKNTLNQQLNAKANQSDIDRINTTIDQKALKLNQVTAGNGLTGGGTLANSFQIVLGTPSTITQNSTNTTTATSHSHAIDRATTTQAGIVTLSHETSGTNKTKAASEFALGEVRRLMNNLSNPTRDQTPNLSLLTWSSITDKPQSFTPSSHVHQASDIADLHTILSKYATKDEIPQINTDGLTIDTSNLATKTSVETLANKVTEASEALKSETKLRANSIAAIDSKITAEIDRRSKKDTEHDDEIASLKRTKADLSHTHTMSEVTDLSAELERYALKTELNNISVDTSHLATKSSVNELSEQIATKADQSHRHTITEVSGLQGILNNKLNSNASAASARKLTTPRRINGIAFDGTQDITLPTPTANVSWSAISNKPTNFTPSSHRHAIGDITNLQRELDNKASRNHSHTWNSITNKPANFTPSAHTHQWSNISNVPSATINNAGIVQLSNNTNGVRQTIAATEFALNEVRKLINSSSRRGSITGVLNRQSHRYFYQRRHGTSSTDAVYSDIDTFTFPDGRIVYLVRLEGIKPAFFDVNTTSVGGSDHTPAKIINLPTAMPNKIISAIPQITSSSLGNTLSSCIVGWDWTYNIDPISGNTRSKSQVRIQFSGYQGNTTNNKIDLSIIVEGY
ncbi:phage tail fiber repeat family protein [Moraxella catarrhalis]|uniref:Phage tail fiber repeat family protein n=1 Tax=Moraxella catarrhalis TaxID=480 RepID=A0A3Q9GIF2_MORCA|nr:tail fiber protein [Moraxella catarrhalis]AZQ94032.1 phage tail fiber repeat family protein [Moraxella catarrhalis]AZQ95113.1 phage tail fiber repeat family protein [Moraxella catarrhalis]RUO14928.1 phage tail fiber repeat family protein [Moraxella catarrhalis]